MYLDSSMHSESATKTKKKINESKVGPRLIELLHNIYESKTANDPLNALIIDTPLTARQINILQTFRNAYLQLNSHYSRIKINKTLLNNSEICHTFIQYFDTKFNPQKREASIRKRKSTFLPKTRQQFNDQLQNVTDITEDIILHQLFNLFEATVRTSYYLKTPDTYIAIKFIPKHINIQIIRQYR